MLGNWQKPKAKQMRDMAKLLEGLRHMGDENMPCGASKALSHCLNVIIYIYSDRSNYVLISHVGCPFFSSIGNKTCWSHHRNSPKLTPSVTIWGFISKGFCTLGEGGHYLPNPMWNHSISNLTSLPPLAKWHFHVTWSLLSSESNSFNLACNPFFIWRWWSDLWRKSKT